MITQAMQARYSNGFGAAAPLALNAGRWPARISWSAREVPQVTPLGQLAVAAIACSASRSRDGRLGGTGSIHPSRPVAAKPGGGDSDNVPARPALPACERAVPQGRHLRGCSPGRGSATPLSRAPAGPSLRGGGVVPRLAHNQEIAGSIPARASNPNRMGGPAGGRWAAEPTATGASTCGPAARSAREGERGMHKWGAAPMRRPFVELLLFLLVWTFLALAFWTGTHRAARLRRDRIVRRGCEQRAWCWGQLGLGETSQGKDTR